MDGAGKSSGPQKSAGVFGPLSDCGGMKRCSQNGSTKERSAAPFEPSSDWTISRADRQSTVTNPLNFPFLIWHPQLHGPCNLPFQIISPFVDCCGRLAVHEMHSAIFRSRHMFRQGIVVATSYSTFFITYINSVSPICYSAYGAPRERDLLRCCCCAYIYM